MLVWDVDTTGPSGERQLSLSYLCSQQQENTDWGTHGPAATAPTVCLSAVAECAPLSLQLFTNLGFWAKPKLKRIESRGGERRTPPKDVQGAVGEPNT